LVEVALYHVDDGRQLLVQPRLLAKKKAIFNAPPYPQGVFPLSLDVFLDAQLMLTSYFAEKKEIIEPGQNARTLRAV
jgi:hypothetical protein